MTLIGAIAVGVIAGYFLRTEAPRGSSSAGQASVPDIPVPRRDVRPLGRPVFTRDLSVETQKRLNEIETLAATDPRKALYKLHAFRDSELLPLALPAIARGWALTDPQAAAQWAVRLETSEDQVSAVLGLVPVWAAKDPEACLAWTSTQHAGSMREVALVEVADTWGSKEPQEALARFLSMKSEAGTERGLHAITAQWALDDPDMAIERVAALPAEQRRDEFLETVLVSLTNQDPDRVWKESTRFDDPKRVEHVRAMSLEAMSETRPQVALNLAASLGNPPELLKAVARGWASNDATAARAWIGTLQDAGLAETLKSQIDPPGADALPSEQGP